MSETTRLPKSIITGTDVQMQRLEGIGEIQMLRVLPYTSIKSHGHDGQWEIWIWSSHKTAYVCLKGEEHRLINNSPATLFLMAIKGHFDYTYEDLSALLYEWGFHVVHGSLVVDCELQ